MRSSKLLLVPCVFAAGVLLAGSALADIVNVSTTTTLFSDDFESQAAGNVSHVAYPDDRVGLNAAHPTGGASGSWGVVFPGGDYSTVNVTDHVGGGDPGANQGKNYLRFDRPTADQSYVSQVFAEQATSHNHIAISQAIYISNQAFGSIQILGNGSAYSFNIITDASGAVQCYSPSAANFVNTGLTYSVGQWQNWKIDYNIGTTTFDLAIDGNVVAGLPTMNGATLNKVYFLKEAATGLVYLDSRVPEPASLVLLASGVAGLLAYAWRKRKS